MEKNQDVERISEVMAEEERQQRLANINNQSRIYGAGAIKRHLQTQKREHGKDAHTSIADQPMPTARQRSAAGVRWSVRRPSAMDELKARIQEILGDYHIQQCGGPGRLDRKSWLPHNHYYVCRKSHGGRITEPVRERKVALRQMAKLQADAIVLLFQQEMMSI